MAGVEVEETTEEDEKDFQGIKIKDGAKIFMHPSFGVTMTEIKEKIMGENFISKKSILWLEGEDTIIRDLKLDSTLISSEKLSEIEGEHMDQTYIEYRPLNPEVDDVDNLQEVIKIRGFQLKGAEEVAQLEYIS